jgi:CRP-like cAMP-binding protein
MAVVGGYPENQLLCSLPAAEHELLRGYIRGVVLAPQTIICEAGDPVAKAYFPYTGAVSLVVVFRGGQMIETAMVGRDGMIGGFSALDGQPASNRAVVQIESAAWAIDAEQLRLLAKQHEPIRSMLLRHERALFLQTQQIAACNASHTLEARLCRWLLRARDACGKRTISITQEMIAELLGVKRTSLSLIAHALQQEGLIRNRRGQIEILNPDGLKEVACECYAQASAHYDRCLVRYDQNRLGQAQIG